MTDFLTELPAENQLIFGYCCEDIEKVISI